MGIFKKKNIEDNFEKDIEILNATKVELRKKPKRNGKYIQGVDIITGNNIYYTLPKIRKKGRF